MELRVCRGCDEAKPLTEYNIAKLAKGGRIWRCKTCNNARIKRWRDGAKGQAGILRGRLATYGLTMKRYEAKLEEQNGVCAIHKGPCVSGRALAIDHDHTCCPKPTPGNKACGKCFRGLLCWNCNQLLGVANDNPDLLEAAADYLRRTMRVVGAEE